MIWMYFNGAPLNKGTTTQNVWLKKNVTNNRKHDYSIDLTNKDIPLYPSCSSVCVESTQFFFGVCPLVVFYEIQMLESAFVLSMFAKKKNEQHRK